MIQPLLPLLLAPLLALPARAADLPPPTDFDGDGAPERVTIENEGEFHVGAGSAECWGDSFPCEVEVHDIKAGDGHKELALCSTGPRGYRTCTLYRYTGQALVELPLKRGDQGLYPERIQTNGSGIVRIDSQQRLYARTDKLLLAGDALTVVQQAAWAVGREVPIDRKVAITRDPGGGPTVANLTPGEPVTLLVESCRQPDHFLVRSSSGLVGWIHIDALQGASDEVMAIYGAG